MGQKEVRSRESRDRKETIRSQILVLTPTPPRLLYNPTFYDLNLSSLTSVSGSGVRYTSLWTRGWRHGPRDRNGHQPTRPVRSRMEESPTSLHDLPPLPRTRHTSYNVARQGIKFGSILNGYVGRPVILRSCVGGGTQCLYANVCVNRFR